MFDSMFICSRKGDTLTSHDYASNNMHKMAILMDKMAFKSWGRKLDFLGEILNSWV